MIDYIIFSVEIAIAVWVGTFVIGIIITVGFALIGIPIWAIRTLHKWIRRNFYKEAEE